jgi:hypothetical protein
MAQAKPDSPNVSYTRPEVVEEMDRWAKIRDCIAGEKAIKRERLKYLPKPNPEDASPENDKRYDSYVTRAVFYNVTRRTLDGLVGQVFMRDPVINIPEALKILLVDADGAGVSLDQQAKKCLSYVMSYGRSGLLVDYPPTEGPVTKADQEAGYVRPTVTLFNPWQILNWRTIVKGARKLLCLLVLRERVPSCDDGFEVTTEEQFRVLRLIDDIYTVELWKDGDQHPFSISIPVDADGKPFDEIPFLFVGSMNNDSELDPPPLFDMAIMNIAHYRNSADYEESSFMVGQPTPWFSGLTQKWVEDVFKGKIMLGSRAAVPLPEGGSAGLLQVSTNTMPFEAMQHKERQMVALGAKLVEQKAVQRTLGEAQMEASAETSILSSAAKNVANAYTGALKMSARFNGDPTDSILYSLNTDFPAARMTPEERAQLVAEWQSGAISYPELRNHLRKAGVATEEDEKVRADNEKDEMRKEAKPPGNPGNSLTGGSENGRVSPSQDGKTQ